MSNRDTSVAALAAELGVKPVTLYRYVDANGNLRDHGRRVLSA
jgi:predicted DNA-binding transcriptional regulator YafY